jgi:hypothetical protein
VSYLTLGRDDGPPAIGGLRRHHAAMVDSSPCNARVCAGVIHERGLVPTGLASFNAGGERCEIKAVTHAPAFRVHSTAVE